jgi:hypothetical protein
MIQKNILIFLMMLTGITIVFAQTSSTCGNNVCEEIKFTLKVGESKTFTVNGIDHTFKLDQFDNGDILSIDGSDPMPSSMERNIFMDEFQVKYGFKLSGSSINYEGNQPSVTYSIEEEFFCGGDCLGEGVYSLKLEPGWNLVYGDIADYGICDQNQPNKLCNDDVLVRYMYVNPLNKYLMVTPTREDLTSGEQSELNSIPNVGEYFENNAHWVFVKNEKSLVLNFKNSFDDSNTVNEMRMFKGWNLITVMPLMIDKNIEDFKGNCEVEKVVTIDPDQNKWIDIGNVDLAGRTSVGAGFAIKVADNCQFQLEEEQIPSIEPPPELPT